MKPTKILILITLAAISTGILHNNFVQKKLSAQERIKKDILTIINKGGASEDIDKIYSKHIENAEIDTHTIEHIIGEVLYQKFGQNGLNKCPKSDLMGCFHGFFIRLSEEKGSEIQYNDLCRSNDIIEKISCIHGVGHGILLNNENVNMALNRCLYEFSESDIFVSMCATGVLMEYHTSSSEHLSNKIMDFSEKNPYDPCPLIKNEELRRYCYLELPHWWKTVTKNDLGKMDALCSNVEKNTLYNYSSWCYKGIGESITVDSDYNIDKIGPLCRALSIYGVYDCLTESAKLLMGRYNVDPELICQYIQSKERLEACKKEANYYIQNLLKNNADKVN